VESANEVACDGSCTGGGVSSAKKIARSHVGNGAVNGDSVRKISQAAITLPNIGVFLAASQDRHQQPDGDWADDITNFWAVSTSGGGR
jgi:hypothetical protein